MPTVLKATGLTTLVLGTLWLSGCDQKAPAAPAAGGAMPVSVVTIQQSDVALGNQWVGTLDGFVNAQIQPQVSGYLVKQNYREGSVVQKGQVLFQIDPRPFQALVDQALGAVGQAKGALAQAQANLGLAQINVNRDAPLAEQRAIAQSQLDNDKQQLAAQQANVEAAKAQIASAEAQVETAKLNLGFTQVRSLISGVAGTATTQVGNLVNAQSVLTSVSQLDPVKVYFSISDAEYLGLTKRATGGRGDLLKGAANLPLTLTLADGTAYPHKGHILFVDRQMNQQTGAIRIASTFPNPGNVLRPGQFGRVSADTQVVHGALTVPQAAVMDLQGQKQLYTVSGDNKVHVVNVTLGDETGKNVVVKSGVPAGTRVIMDQLQKLKDGMPVSPHAAVAESAPTSDPDAGSAGAGR
ncbi:efflux RND transporter periplasmic adaptor subunit [Terriglobus roseus]|nr:efflux RND transporter periplasmic adaptor subunit [Terriglobus roseus]